MSLPIRSYFLAGMLLFLISFSVLAKKPERYVKKKYQIAYKSIKEWSYRKDPNNKRIQKAELNLQSEAFMKIAAALEDQPDEKLEKTIELALLRWGWLQGVPLLNNPNQVDYYMVWMELRQKLPHKFEPEANELK